MRQRLALDLLPALTHWLNRLERWLRLNREIIEQRLDQALQMTVRGIEAVARVALTAGRSVQWLSQQLERLTGVGAGGQIAAIGLGAAALLATRHPVLAAMGALLIVLDDVRAFVDGDDSALGWALDWLDRKLEELGTSFEEWGAAVEDVLAPVIDSFRALEAILNNITELLNSIGDRPRALQQLDDEGPEWPTGSGGWLRQLERLSPSGLSARLLEEAAKLLEGRSAAPPGSGQTTRELMGEILMGPSGLIGRIMSELGISAIGSAEAAPDSDPVPWLNQIMGGLDELSSGLKPGDTNVTRNVDFNQTVNTTINQNVSGATAPERAGEAVGRHAGEAGRRAADIAAQEPSLDSLAIPVP